MNPINRPTSPHLQIYRPQLTTSLSILHRMTGVALSVGSILLVWWLIAAASGEDTFDEVQRFLGGPIGRILLLGWTLALFYHLCNGIRHLVWDTGRALDLRSTYIGGWLALAAAAVLTAISWVTGLTYLGR